ncbi:sugar ABC transporter permease [Ruania alkalisoli]|uniref:Sugar ABC transporter permease n=1 Tax=Ruania alkalisoli TaxID=2779775 RepID=A0A7M1SS65_9MICO|nr:sugar ABC transporter permease [Ruania alkalisoli]QOR70396.1 sugar ABC transporter permease [Ruania alkalisoli]
MTTHTSTAPRSASHPRGVNRGRGLRAVPFLVPATLLYVYFLAYPMVDSVRLSFFEWSGFRTEEPVWVGLQNYVRLFTADPVFWTAAKNSIIWVALSLALPVTLGLLIALGLNRAMLGRNTMRAVIYLPAVFAPITVAAMWRWIYNPTLGALNQFLTAVGLESWAQQWLGDPTFALYSVFAASVWTGVGFTMVLFLAGLQQVPPELVDAAKVDGAGRWQVFRNVTVPALRPTTAVVVILTIINSLKVFDLVVGMTGGGPAQSTQVLALWSYTQSFANHTFGLGGATATVLLIMSLALVVPYLVWALRGDDR